MAPVYELCTWVEAAKAGAISCKDTPISRSAFHESDKTEIASVSVEYRRPSPVASFLNGYETSPTCPTKTAADAERNRDRVLEVARRLPGRKLMPAWTTLPNKQVGAGTLYRHFPWREALIEAL